MAVLCVLPGVPLMFMKQHRVFLSKPFPSVPLRTNFRRKHGIHVLQKGRSVAGVIHWQRHPLQHSFLPTRRFMSSGSTTAAPTYPVEEETVSDTAPDEFYPVHIGDTFQDKYKVVGKLGYGVNSTIWLGRDLQSGHYVALKIYIRTPSWYRGVSRETRIYEHLGSLHSMHPGQTCIREVFDFFRTKRSDGTRHECIVHPPLHMSLFELQRLDGKSRGLDVDTVKDALRNLFMALDFLHTEANVTHGDIKAGNLMLTVSDESMLKDFEEAEIKSPAPKKVINSERTIYASRNFRRPRNHAWGHPVLCDFGEGSIGRKHAYKAIQPTIYKAPEIVMESEWSHSADIWNVGCMIWDIFENKHLFDGHDEDGVHSDRRHVSEMIAYIGLPPLEFQKRCKRSPLIFDEDGNWKGNPAIPSISLEESEERLEGEEKQMFLEFIRSMLRWVPEERKRARELLEDPWLKG